MAGTIEVDYKDLLIVNLGGLPDIEYRLYWRGDAFVFDHGNSLFIEKAIERVESAMEKLRQEYGLPAKLKR